MSGEEELSTLMSSSTDSSGIPVRKGEVSTLMSSSTDSGWGAAGAWGAAGGWSAAGAWSAAGGWSAAGAWSAVVFTADIPVDFVTPDIPLCVPEDAVALEDVPEDAVALEDVPVVPDFGEELSSVLFLVVSSFLPLFSQERSPFGIFLTGLMISDDKLD